MNQAILLVLTLILAGLPTAGLGQKRIVNPSFFSGTGMPALSKYTRLSTDTAKDQATDHLDIVADYFAYSRNKFYVAIQNRGGGFPRTGALGFPPYYSYMFMLANPANDPKDPKSIVWVLNYMQVTLGGITPGLYKITGKGAKDLIRIGNISTAIDRSNNLLKMSCDIAPLLADPDFTAWYDPDDPLIGTGSMTSRTTLSGLTPVTKETDTTTGVWISPK